MSPFQKSVAVFKSLECVYCHLPQGPGFPGTHAGELVGKCHCSHPVPAAPFLFHRDGPAQAQTLSKMVLSSSTQGLSLHPKGQKCS